MYVILRKININTCIILCCKGILVVIRGCKSEKSAGEK